VILDAIRRRARPADHHHLITGSTVLVVGAAVQALGGSIFWLIAAKLDPQRQVGAATALFTSVQFVTYLAGLGLPVSLARYSVGRGDDADTTFTWAVIATSIASVLASIGYLIFLAVDKPPSTEALSQGPFGWTVVFTVAVIGSAFSLIVDVRCMTIRRWNLVLARITIVAIVRLPLVFLIRPDQNPALWLFLFSVLPVAVTGVIGALAVSRVAGGRLRLGPRPATAGAAVRYSAVNYLSTLGYQAPYFALPVIVLANVTARVNASFYVAWGIVAVAFYVPSAIGQALLAQGGKDGVNVEAQLRLAMLLAGGLMLLGTIATFVGSSLVTAVYGVQYRDAARILPAMMAAGIPWAITSLYLTEARVLHRHVSTVIITLTLTIAIVIPALVLVPDDGIYGARDAWVIGNIIAAVVAITAHAIGTQRMRSGRQREVVDAVAVVPRSPVSPV